MKLEVYSNADAVAQKAAALVAAEARAAVAARGAFVMAVSGGHTPWEMLRALAGEDVPWDDVHVVQVDERVAPTGDPDRNLTHLRESLLEHAPLRPERIHAMPVESLIHLGLGPDGHTASLLPGDAVLEIKDADVALTGFYQGRRRMTLTYPILNRPRRVLWLVTGSEKAGMLARLRAGDAQIPAGRVRADHALVLADRTAAGRLNNDAKAEVA